jgi:iron complex outermembrane recepter protein
MSKMTRSCGRVAAVSLLALAMTPALALAQGGDPSPAPAKPAAQDNGGEIVVTALRRDTTLSKTPAAIVAVSGSQLMSQGVSTSKDLPNIMPNIQQSVAGFAIRGVSSADFTEKGDPATAYNVNGVYIARFTEQALALFDVDRVEVLRGPQGTLYGRNATAGVVNVITAKPKDKFEASGSIEYGNYNTFRVNGMVNTPLTDWLDLRVAAATNKHDGYTPTHDGTRAQDDQDDAALRVSLLARLGDRTDLLINGDYGIIDQTGPASLPAARALAQNDNHALRYSLPGVDNYYKMYAGGISAELNSDLGFAKLTYIGSYRASTFKALTSKNDVVPGNWDDLITQYQNHDQTTQELRLASQGNGKLTWVGGLYYFREHSPYTDALDFQTGGFTLGYNLIADATSYAAFGQATYAILDGLRFTGGLRYTNDSKSRVGVQNYIINGTNLSFPSTYAGFYPGGQAPRDKVTWRAQFEGDLAPGVLAYGGVSTGYKAGGFNDGTPSTAPAGAPFIYQPELITSYEGGLKGTFFDRKLYGALSVFHYDYKNHQVDAISPAGGAVTLNAPAKVTGAELEGYVRPLRHTTINYSASVLDAKFGHFQPGLLTGNTTDIIGQSLDFAPKFSARVGLMQEIPLANGARITGDVSVKYSSSYTVTDYVQIVRYVQTAYTRTDVTVSYYAPGDKWYVQAFGKNLENNRLLGLVEIGGFTLTDPMTYGVRAGFKF